MIDFKVAGRIRPDQTSPARTASGRTLPNQVSIQWRSVRATAVILIALATIALTGCATSPNQVTYPTAPLAGTVSIPGNDQGSQTAANKANGVVGVWDGLTLASCDTSPPSRCNAQEKVTLTFIEGASGITGYYRCAYSTMDCLGQNETGKVANASLSGGLITARVEMSDGTSCLYTGHTADNIVNGGYSCYAGGSLIESGSWNAKRTY